MNPVIYCQPKFHRGTGLGNRLFPWARCRVFARRHGAQMISPLWFRPAVGQLFRGGIDYQSYLRQIALFGLFDKRDGDLGILHGLWEARGVRQVSETLVQGEIQPPERASCEPLKVNFDQFVFQFGPLNGWSDFLHAELRKITRRNLLAFVDSVGDVAIGVNIRCGNDFSKAPDDPRYERVGWLQKTPISWYRESLEVIRQAIGFPARAVVVSDGKASALQEILEMENVAFLRPGTAITDLLVLSKARVLLATGSSTFSAWASFLGQMPAVTVPGHPLTEWAIKACRKQYIGEFNPHTPSAGFLDQAKDLLREH